MYWNKVERYLQTEEDDESKKEQADDEKIGDYGGEELIDEIDSFDQEKQRKGLNVLLNIILMVHQNKPSGSRWEKLFDFNKYFKKLKYAPEKEGRKVNPILLRKFIREINVAYEQVDENGEVTEEFFVEKFNEEFFSDQFDDFKKEVHKRWDDIKVSLNVIKQSEKIFVETRIGIIMLTNASALDAQNIFSRINKGGTQLKAEELLSAKPYWNKVVEVTDYTVRELVKSMYTKIGIPIPDQVVRWDLAATFISRIKDSNLIFDSYTKFDEKNEIAMERVTLGFKMLSSIYEYGMSGKSVVDLEKNDNIKWDKDIDELLMELNVLVNILVQDSFFACFQSWKKPISKLLGNAIALEFFTIMWLDWKEKGSPQYSTSGNMKAFQRDGRILFDRLVFEYTSKTWRGSGDSKMSNDIKNWKTRLVPIEEGEWSKLLGNAFNGMINGEQTTVSLLRPILYYYYSVTEHVPLNQADVSFDVDHIIPQESFVSNVMIDQILKDSLGNFAILPTKSNISKKAKRLDEISDLWLKKQIVTYAYIPEDDFIKYSDVSKIGELCNQRFLLYENKEDDSAETFMSKRRSSLSK